MCIYTVTNVCVYKEACVHAHVTRVFSRVRDVRDKNTQTDMGVAKVRVHFVVYTCVVYACHI